MSFKILIFIITTLVSTGVYSIFLNRTCTIDAECDEFFEGATCVSQDPYDREPRLCACPLRKTATDDGTTCVNRVFSLYGSCFQDSQCSLIGAICLNGECRCSRLDHYNRTTQTCSRNDYEFYCTPSKGKTDCDQVNIADCGYEPVVPQAREYQTVCKCNLMDEEKASNCEVSYKKLGASCRKISECRDALTQPWAICELGTCKCLSASAHKGKNGVCWKTLKYGQSCYNSNGFERLAECYQPSENGTNMLTCVEDKCVCVPGLVYKNGSCVADIPDSTNQQYILILNIINLLMDRLNW